MKKLNRAGWQSVAMAAMAVAVASLTACGGGGNDDPVDTPSGTTAVGCLPSAQFVSGYRSSLTYAYTSVVTTNGVAGTPTSDTITMNRAYAGTTTLAGGITAHVTNDSWPASPTFTSVDYNGISGNVVLTYGSDDLTAGSPTHTTRYVESLDFGISVGQSRSYSYTQTDTNPSGTFTVSGSYSLAGVESLSTPLGTFTNTCKLSFSETSTDTSTGERTTESGTAWLSAGSGLTLKTVTTSTSSSSPTQSTADEITLTSGSINGTTLVAQ